MTMLLIYSSLGVKPACASPLDSALEKHPASAAPINSSGFVSYKGFNVNWVFEYIIEEQQENEL